MVTTVPSTTTPLSTACWVNAVWAAGAKTTEARSATAAACFAAPIERHPSGNLMNDLLVRQCDVARESRDRTAWIPGATPAVYPPARTKEQRLSHAAVE